MPPETHRLKVGYVIGELGIGGAERQLLNKIHGLRGRGFDIFVVALSAGGVLADAYTRAGARVYEIPRSHSLELGRIIKLAGILKRERPLIVQGEQYDAGAYARVAAVLAGVPVRILAVRSAYSRLRPRYRFTEAVLKHFTDAYIVNAEAIKRLTVAHHGLDPRRVHVANNTFHAVDHAGRPPQELRRELGLDENALSVGIVASFSPEKNHTRFLEFARRVADARPQTRFFLIGDGPRRPQIEAAIGRLALGDHVRLLGTRHDVPDLLQVLDVSVNTSVREGQNNAIIESIAAGTPVLASNVGGTPEIVASGRHGELFDLDSLDHMVSQFEKIVADLDHYRSRIRRDHASFLARFDPEHLIDQHYEIYADCLERRGIRLENPTTARAANG